MNFTLRLTLDDLVDALRMKAHSLADGAGNKRRPRPTRPAETELKPDMKGLPQKKGESDDLARG